MFDFSTPDDGGDRPIIRRIGEHHYGVLAIHQSPEVRVGAGISAEQAMVTEQPKIASFGNGLAVHNRKIVGWIMFRIRKVDRQSVDLGSLETGNGNIEIDLRQENSKLAEFLGKYLAIPACIGGDLVVREHQGPLC